MKVAIHQPDYLPYLGYFKKMSESDVFVFLDDAQYSSSNYHNWNRIKDGMDEIKIKVPVLYRFGDRINEVVVDYGRSWQRQHLELIERNYWKADYYTSVAHLLEMLILMKYKNLAELNSNINMSIARSLGIGCKFLLSSQLGISGRKEERIINICRHLGADTYLSGLGAKAYQNTDNFRINGIALQYCSVQNITYKQQGEQYLGNLSIIDYLLNCGLKNPFGGPK